MFEIGDQVRIKYGVLYNGHDLTSETGIVRSLESYVIVFIPRLNLVCKMLRHEIELYVSSSFEEITLEDIGSSFH
jgi:hypothetical protein